MALARSPHLTRPALTDSRDLSHRERGTTRRSSFPGTSSRIAERERAGSTDGTPAELDPAARPRRYRNSTPPPARAVRGTRPRRRGNSTRNGRPPRGRPNAASGRESRVCIGARRGRRSATVPINPSRKAKRSDTQTR